MAGYLLAQSVADLGQEDGPIKGHLAKIVMIGMIPILITSRLSSS